MKLKQLEKIQNTIHSEDQFGEQDHTLKYSILSLIITVIMFIEKCFFSQFFFQFFRFAAFGFDFNFFLILIKTITKDIHYTQF